MTNPSAPHMAPEWVPHADPTRFDMGRTLRTDERNELTDDFQDQGENPRVPDLSNPVDSGLSEYVETQADHAFSAFLSSLTPSRVLRDRELTFSKAERKRMLFLRQKSHVEALARQAREGTAA